MQHREYKVVYRRYASLFFIVGVSEEEVKRRSPLPPSQSPLPCPALPFPYIFGGLTPEEHTTL